jgi:hypothetical protein
MSAISMDALRSNTKQKEEHNTTQISLRKDCQSAEVPRMALNTFISFRYTRFRHASQLVGNGRVQWGVAGQEQEQFDSALCLGI